LKNSAVNSTNRLYLALDVLRRESASANPKPEVIKAVQEAVNAIFNDSTEANKLKEDPDLDAEMRLSSAQALQLIRGY